MNPLLYAKVEGSGKPLIILHGFFGMSDNWKSIATQLAAQGLEVHVLDLRNHGRSFHSEEFSYDAMVQDVMRYVDAQSWENYVVIGHSMGGKVAMLLAANDARVQQLIVADIGPKYYAPHHQTILKGLNAIDFNAKPSRGEVDEVLSQHITEFGVRQFLLKNLYWQTPETLSFRFHLKVLTEKVEEVGKALPADKSYTGPTLFLYGKKSNYVLSEDMPEIRKQFPSAQFVGLEGAGHWLHAEKPQEFLQEVLRFIHQF